jgi:hypothetical protein
MIPVQKATFKKKDGSLRTMIFCEVQNLPKELVAEKIKGNGVGRKLSDGSKVVYDLEARDFRIFNQLTIVGEIEEVNLDSVFDSGYIF